MDKTVLLQKQIRDNSDDLRAYLQDLSKWEEDMKRKESEINSSDSESQVPLVRNKVKKTDENKDDGPKETEKSKKRINSYDYASWDKFDVDAECEKINIAKKEEAEKSEDEEPSEEYKQLLRDEAIREKEKGNQFVKNKKWDEAISCYTHAIACDPKDPIFFANRALLHSAEADCTSALQLDPTYVKALQRRAAARDGLKQLQDAVTDLNRVLELEPHNIESKKELQKLEKLLGINKQKMLVKTDKPQSIQKSSIKELNIEPTCSLGRQNKSSPTEIHIPWPNRGTCEIMKPIDKRPHQRSKQPLRRIEIVETDTSELSLNKNQTTVDNTSELNVDYKESNALAKILAQTSQLDVDEILKDIDSNVERTNKRETNEEFNKIMIDTTPDDLAGIVSQSSESNMDEIRSHNNSDAANVENTELPTEKLNVNTPEKGRKVSFSEKIELIPKQEIFTDTENDADMDEILPDQNEQCIFPVPKTAHSFYTDWCQIRNNQEQKNLYLQQIPPQELPSIFRHALESHVFSEMIHILNDYFIENNLRVFEFVKHLSDVKRFSTMIMFAASEDKLALNEIFDYMVAQKESSAEDIEALKIKYEL
ncbi:spaghetti [Carabus blaptoides fortunei]